MIWILTIVLALLLIVVIYKYGKHNAEFKVIGECIYKDKILFSDSLFVKNSVYTIRYDFKDGRICGITVRFYDESVLYTFAPYWKIYCYGRNKEPIKVEDFSQLYVFDTNPNSMLKLLTKEYPSLENLPKIEQKSPDVSERFVF